MANWATTPFAIIRGSATPFYDNPWIIGLATGVASGVLLAIITPALLQRRKIRELAIRRERSAEDILSALRPSVATGNFPSAPMVEAIRRASAYNRGLRIEQAVAAADLLDVLATEIMTSSFIGPELRIATADKILALRLELSHEATDEPTAVERLPADLKTTIMIVGFGAAVFGLIGAISVLTKNVSLTLTLGSLAVVALGMLATVIGATDFKLGFGNVNIQMHRRVRDPD